MKKRISLLFIVWLMHVPLVFGLTGQEIMAKCKKSPIPMSGKSDVILNVYKDNQVTVNEISFITKRSEDFKSGKALASVTKPSKLKILIHLKEDGKTDQWVKLSTGKVKRIVGLDESLSFIDSHFSIEDLNPSENMISWEGDYFTFNNLGTVDVQGDACYKIEALPKNLKQRYEKFILYIRESDCLPRRSEFYQGGKIAKIMENSDIRMVQGYPTPFKIVMQIPDSEEKSEIILKSIQYDVEINDLIFRKEALH